MTRSTSRHVGKTGSSSSSGFRGLCRDLATRLGVEAVACQERIRPLPTPTRVLDPGERPGVLLHQALRGGTIRWRDSPRTRPPLLEHAVDYGAVDALEPQLFTERVFAAWSRSVAGLDPGTRECLIVEHTEVPEAGDGTLDQLGSIARAGQPAADLGDGPRPRLEEPGGGVQNDLWIVDRGSPLAPLGI